MTIHGYPQCRPLMGLKFAAHFFGLLAAMPIILFSQLFILPAI
jgi:hypothetical protein